jgi:hypothetical protein
MKDDFMTSNRSAVRFHDRRSKAGSFRHGEAGAALLVMLVAVAILSAVAVAALHSTQVSSQAARLFLRELVADEASHSAIALAKAQLAVLGSNEQRKGHLLASVGAAQLTIDFAAETGRVDINHGDPQLLAAVLAAAGMKPDDAEDAVGVLRQGTMKIGAAATAGAMPAPGSTKQLPPTSLSRLLTVPGISPGVYAAAAPLLTPCSGERTIDPGLSPPKLITLLMGGNPAQGAAFIRANGDHAPTKTTPEGFPLAMRPFVADALAPPVGTRLDVEVRVDGLVKRYEGILCAPRGNFAQAQIVEWTRLQ